MSECTKGEMKAGKINCGQFPISIDGRHFAIIKFTHLIDMKQDEANAKELVRRFNAFEEGGLVEELRTACEAWGKVESEMRDKTPCPDLALRAQYRKEAVKLTEAALAKS